MAKIFNDNSLSIGNTPLIKLNRLSSQLPANIYVKTEGRNPGYSLKCRIGAGMVWDAEKRGLLKPGMEIIEPTSGNTGIALAFVAASRGYRLTLVMPDTMSIERRKIVAAFGAKLILSPGIEGMRGAVQTAEDIVLAEPTRYYLPQQFRNPSNPAIHEQTSGPEIWNDTDGEVDVVVAGIGTGGTITGISRFLKRQKHKTIVSVGVEPASSPVLTQHLKGEKLHPGAHRIQGIGAGFIPEVLDLTVIDRIETVTDDDAIDFARRMAREEGIICGISSGAAVAVALRLAALPEFAGKNFVVILPDSGERYLSTSLYQDPA